MSSQRFSGPLASESRGICPTFRDEGQLAWIDREGSVFPQDCSSRKCETFARKTRRGGRSLVGGIWAGEKEYVHRK
ncbi:hypothetical protein RvY_03571 [Ramazzottius varieornatus]|uniref:Uncharacterized protein n=1 Tax=Ramazzottius varieornatus TaxID=947166 RepID=A0A1D1UNJ8_RAMVA|nr:hypothetical protein RvY_03571 [Ramazzottius varieornatus]